MTATSKRKERIRRVPHIIAGVIIFLHGAERLEAGHGGFLFFFLAGLVFLSLAVFHHRVAARFPLVDAVFLVIESTVSMVVAYEYFSAGKHALPWAYVFAAFMQLVAVFIFYKRKKKQLAGAVKH